METLNHIKKIEKYLNSRHNNMKFAFKVEQNDKLCFLDIKISRDGNKFETSLYRKPTFSGIYTNFNCFIPMTYKCGLIHSFTPFSSI